MCSRSAPTPKPRAARESTCGAVSSPSLFCLAGSRGVCAAMMSPARLATTTIVGHAMDNLSTIAAVVLGGTSLFGGVGSIAGTVVGVFIPIVLLNGFVIMGIPPFWQTVATGAVL